MYRFASSLLASAVIVFLGTTLLGTTLSSDTTASSASQPKIIATVVAHAHPAADFAVHGL